MQKRYTEGVKGIYRGYIGGIGGIQRGTGIQGVQRGTETLRQRNTGDT